MFFQRFSHLTDSVGFEPRRTSATRGTWNFGLKRNFGLKFLPGGILIEVPVARAKVSPADGVTILVAETMDSVAAKSVCGSLVLKCDNLDF